MLQRLKHYFDFLWSLAGLNVRLMYGMWKLTKLPQPAITIFGGARIEPDGKHAKQAKELAKRLAGEGVSIITGGGPGIMEAANQGAYEHLKECDLGEGARCKPVMSAGVSLVRLNKEKANPFVQENIVMEYFFARKWLLVRYSIGFVIFPGGFGTMDELFEIITLAQTQRMQRAPIILMDTNFWQPLVEWIETRALKEGLIGQEDVKLIKVLDDVEEAFKILRDYCAQCQ